MINIMLSSASIITSGLSLLLQLAHASLEKLSIIQKSAYQKNTFLISQPKHVMWELKRTVSMRRFFWAPKTYVKTDGLENVCNFTHKHFVYLML